MTPKSKLTEAIFYQLSVDANGDVWETRGTPTNNAKRCLGRAQTDTWFTITEPLSIWVHQLPEPGGAAYVMDFRKERK